MLRLYLDGNDGAGLIPCPECGRPMLLGVERMGCWLVGYKRGFRIRPGQRAMLVCPGYECPHKEDVLIAGAPDDAVVYSAIQAAWWFGLAERSHCRTLDDLQAVIRGLRKLYNQGGHPKLPSAVRFWREELKFQYWHVKDYLARSFNEPCTVHLDGDNWTEKGTVKELMEHGVMLERSETGETVLIRVGDLRSVAMSGDWFTRPARFDFGRENDRRPQTWPIHVPTSYVVIDGHPLMLDCVTAHGLCRVRTKDPEIARAFRMWCPEGAYCYGELPLALVQRYYRVIRYCHVRGYRLYLSSFTKDPDLVKLETRDLETARALLMHRAILFWGERNALKWWGYFHRDEITAEDEIRVPLELRRLYREKG